MLTRRLALRSSVGIVLALSYGCGKTGGVAPRPTPRVFLQPADITSDAGQIAIRVIVDNGSISVGRAILETLAKEVSLVDWPAMAGKIPISMTVRESTGEKHGPSGEPRSDPGYIDIIPSAPLADRWYFLRVASVPHPLSWSGQLKTAPDGARGVRFRPGSDPVLRGILRCPKIVDDVVYVELSEPMSVSPGQITLDRAGTEACSLVDGGPRPAISHGLRCPRGLFAGTQATLTFSPELKAPSGKSLRVPNAVEILTTDRFKPDSTGCPAIRIDW